MNMTVITILLAGLVVGGVFYQGSLSEKCEKIEEFRENAEELIEDVQAEKKIEINQPSLVM